MDTLGEYYQVFKAQVDTVEAHGGNPGYHRAVYQTLVDAYAKENDYDTTERLKTLKGEELKKMKAEAVKIISGAYLGCIFLIMAN